MEIKPYMRVMPVAARDIGKPLVEAGILPPNTKRFVIDCDINSAVKIYYECYGSEDQASAIFDTLIRIVKDGEEKET